MQNPRQDRHASPLSLLSLGGVAPGPDAFDACYPQPPDRSTTHFVGRTRDNQLVPDRAAEILTLLRGSTDES